MQQSVNIILSPEQAANERLLKNEACAKAGVQPQRVKGIRIEHKTVDARQRMPKINLSVRLYIDEAAEGTPRICEEIRYQDVHNKPQAIVVGAGPAGLFAALRLIELGVKPIIVERGKSVSERKIDIAQASRNKVLNLESNFSFGEGGAGAFSDGKLYTRSKKKGNTSRILQIFHDHGAQDEILYEAHPHIGTDRLSVVIKNMRKTILQYGGEVHFCCKMTDLIIENGTVRGIACEDGREFKSDAVILATGHSARDVYKMLDDKKVALEAKGFAMGVRVEHPQALIDSIQYHRKERGEYLPPAAYNIVAQSAGRGVYSFCMCPGGQIVPASTENDGIVVNGMSNSLRNSPYANSGIVVEIRPEDLESTEWGKYGNFSGLMFQKHVEQLAFKNNGGLGLAAPAQRLADFVKGRLSSSLPKCSYLPGAISSPMHFWLPDAIGKRLQDGFKQFDRKMRGFVTNEAVILGVESRSSSPIRIPRDRETLQHTHIKGLFPCGEGAGYSGGITSSGIDGELCAENAAKLILGV
ncbi:MAG: FAD-binding protein [Paludibacteraceae bacterium]|nr:FAD-binding protein [Paludibacteraceae bacterium]